VTRRVDDGTSQAPVARLVVPAYFHPNLRPGDWEWLAAHAGAVSMVVLNVFNGPGDAPEAPFKDVTERLREAGVRLVGYVDTNYGIRPAGEVMTELGRYQDWYDVSGVCLDRVAAEPRLLAYYGAMAARVRKMGADIVFYNHGVYPDEGYAKQADLLGTFEGPWTTYRQLDVPRWAMTHWPDTKFYHVVHSVPRERLGEAARLVSRRHAASFYVTEGSGGHPYDRLPADFRS
jgi:hypothetical protein